MTMIDIRIDGRPYQVEEGLTILYAVRECGFNLPSLCAYNSGECNQGSCRACLVEIEGMPKLVASCVYPVSEGMNILISSQRAALARRRSVELLLSNHADNCQGCDKNEYCELLHVARQVGVREGRFAGAKTPATYDALTPSIVRDTSKCILCGRCIERCRNTNGNGVLAFINRGFDTVVGPAGNISLAKSPCLMCGQCVNVCPTGALMAKSEVERVDEAILSGKHVVAQTAPAVRAALGECFDMPIGTPVTGKMVNAMKHLGFSKVYDTDFGADLTIMEEASELIDRIEHGGVLPMITSCSPGWINYCETWYPDILPHVSSCKSPHQMQGAIIKSYYAERHGLDPKDVYVVSVMPCTAKKYEKERPQMRSKGVRDVDAVITTRELGDMIKRSGIVLPNLRDEPYDTDIMGDASGAGVIFGQSGGVMEAALRTAYYVLEGREHEPIEFEEVRGAASVREASVTMGGMTLDVAVVSGMANARPLLEAVRNGTSKYHFIEVMCCPGGCVNGGGQPYVHHRFRPNEDPSVVTNYVRLRREALFSEDRASAVRQSHNNPQIRELYEDFLGAPNSEMAHHLLHTTYAAREPFRL